MNSTRLRRRHISNSRHGSAPIEFVMWLPLLMFLFWLILACGHLFLINCEVVAETRQMAWQGRHQPWRQSNGTYQEGQIPALPQAGRHLSRINKPVRRYFQDNNALPTGWEADRGFLTAQHTKVVPFTIEALSEMRNAHSTHFVLGGVWDYQELPFEDRDEHKRLEPSKKFQYYFHSSNRRVDFSPLKQLASLGGRQATANSGGRTDVDTKPEESKRLHRERQRVVNTIENVEQEIARYEQQLRDLYSEPEPDYDAIRDVKGRLDTAGSRLKKLETGLADLDRSVDVQKEIRAESDRREKTKG